MASEDNTESLAGWVMERVNAWEEWRTQNYDSKWDEYYRLWRGFWTELDANSQSERSRIVCPELAQAIETCVAELEDATFIRDRWIDVKENVDVTSPETQKEMSRYVDYLLDDFKEYGVVQSISEAYQNGALYGTGIAKIVVDKCKEPVISKDPNIPSIDFKSVYKVKLVPIAPRNFVIDPSARSVDEALGCAHVFQVPMNVVQKSISDGMYNSIPLAPFGKTVDDLRALAEFEVGTANTSCKIVEYHGLVPKKFINKSETIADPIAEAIAKELPTLDTTISAVQETETEELIEAIVTIVNDMYIAKAVANPFLFGDRSIVAYQHDTVPNRFWGRGVAEKGYNPQKALDAEVRARIDALGLSTHPMMGIDATRIPRGERFEVRPGRNILTNGPPGDALFPLKFNPPDPHTFQQTQELREMIQRATGGYELPAMMNDANRMAATSMSMVVGSMIKRSRRTLSNIEREFLGPIVKKALYRYMQFDPERFPLKEYNFRVRSSMGIMAREFEQGQHIALLSNVPQESPAFWMLVKGIYENSTLDSREEMIQFCDKFLQNSLNPQPPPPDPKVQVKTLKLAFEKKKHEDLMDLEASKLLLEKKRTESDNTRKDAQSEFDKALALLEAVKAETEKQRVEAEALSKLMKGYSDILSAQAAMVSASQTKNADGSVSGSTEPDDIEFKDLIKEFLPVLKDLKSKSLTNEGNT